MIRYIDFGKRQVPDSKILGMKVYRPESKDELLDRLNNFVKQQNVTVINIETIYDNPTTLSEQTIRLWYSK